MVLLEWTKSCRSTTVLQRAWVNMFLTPSYSTTKCDGSMTISSGWSLKSRHGLDYWFWVPSKWFRWIPWWNCNWNDNGFIIRCKISMVKWSGRELTLSCVEVEVESNPFIVISKFLVSLIIILIHEIIELYGILIINHEKILSSKFTFS